MTQFDLWLYEIGLPAFIQPIVLQLILLLSKLIKSIRYYGYNVGKFIQEFADLESIDQMVQNLDRNISNLEQKRSVLEHNLCLSINLERNLLSSNLSFFGIPLTRLCVKIVYLQKKP